MFCIVIWKNVHNNIESYYIINQENVHNNLGKYKDNNLEKYTCNVKIYMLQFKSCLSELKWIKR